MFNESLIINIEYLLFISFSSRQKSFNKIVDLLRGTEPPTISQLGLEFLRLYDGKFNYPEGHTVWNYLFFFGRNLK